MSQINRRQWMQKSLLASSLLLTGSSFSSLQAGCEEPSLMLNGKPIRLNSNENPYGPSEGARKAIVEALTRSNRYPTQAKRQLKENLASKFQLKAENFLITAGSTEILSLLGQHVSLVKGEIVLPWPSFPTIMRFGKRCGTQFRKVDLNSNDQVDLDRLLEAINEQTTMVYLCNPNNPTGTEVAPDDLRSFCRKVPDNILIAVDEAYIEYSQQGEASSLINLVDELPNLIICRTFSKAYGLAGLRIGFAVSSAANIKALKDRHAGFEIAAGIAPIAAAEASLEDEAFIRYCVKKNAAAKNIVYKAFDEWDVFYRPSSTNFIYTGADRFDPDIVSKLRGDNFLITKWTDMTKHIRISIGKPEEMEAFVEVIKKYLI